MRVYLDSSPIIYLVEQMAPFAAKVLTRIGTPGIILASSDLALLEALVKPVRNNDVALVQEFDKFFAVQIVARIPFTESLFRRAADIRARHNFRTPDALHLAAAVEGACDLFLTNDAGLTSFTQVPVEIVA
jgi:predicted nucleic acid-binding protein